MMIRFTLPLIFIALVFGVCHRKSRENLNLNKADAIQKKNDLSRDTVTNGIEVTFYPAYGYRNGTDWLIPMRTWVHEIRDSTATPLRKKAGELATSFVCAGEDENALKQHLRDFSTDDIDEQEIEIQFDADPARERYRLVGTQQPNGASDHNGLIQSNLTLPDAKAQQMIKDQGSVKGWLTYHAVTNDPQGKVFTGKGRIRLIEPEGTSVVTDIDDTIKVSEVPSAVAVVLKNTFCRSFVAAPGMAKMYRDWGDDVPFHYVSGGPWQLYGPLYDYLISGPGAYPEGTFHFNYFPKNVRSEDTREILKQAVAGFLFESKLGSLKDTYDHKQKRIIELMDRFPGRTFIFIGDSGEMDPEVYRWFQENPKYSKQVKEIWIRDVVNDAQVNPDRLQGMKVIPADPIICATQSHYNKVSAMIARLHRPAYARNMLSPCHP
jgi:phosphatidate phosphatase APP1